MKSKYEIDLSSYNTEDIRKELQNITIVTKHGITQLQNSKFLALPDDNLLKTILSEYDISLHELNCLMNENLTTWKRCEVCGSYIAKRLNKTNFCCARCAQKSKVTREKIYNTLKANGNIKEKVLTEYDLMSRQEKRKYTCIQKYGVDSPMKVKEIRQKASRNKLEKINNDFSRINEKIKNTCIQKYGVDWYSKSPEFKPRITKKFRAHDYDKFVEQLKDTSISLLDTREEFIENMEHTYFCQYHNETFISSISNVQKVQCPKCHEANTVSSGHGEVVAFIKENYDGEVLVNTRAIISPLELDIYIPELKLGIEYDGLYWHSNLGVDDNYHLHKTEECLKKDIQLIHIFENEWLYNRDIVKSILLSKLNKSPNKIFARKCVMKEVSTADARQFLDENHMQGYCNAKNKLGLYYNDELVEIITYGKSRFKKDETELIRHCTKLYTSVVGGFSKLTKNLHNIVSYVDRRYFNGSGYEKTGWKFVSISKPNYFYITSNRYLEPRQKYQKHKLSALLPKFNAEYTEKENMAMNNYTWIFDCGNIKYKK